MTLDEAIKYAEDMAALSHKGSGNAECEQNHRQLAEWLKELQTYRNRECETCKNSENGKCAGTEECHKCMWQNQYEQEPCEDAISRQAVLEQTYNWSKDEFLRVTNPFDYLRKRINSLPSVTPAEKEGHWITQWNLAHQKEYYYCSECREEYSYDGETGIKMNDYKYCPNCGAKMVDPQESEVQDADSD